jgi:probable biosynthetic protein (TIGR04099 family)
MRMDHAEIATLLIDPSPHEDFNGADFLYFAAFQAMLDRAEWHWLHRMNPLLVTAERQIIYLGNIELGDQVRATLYNLVDQHDTLAHCIALSRASDGQTIAVAFSRRRPTRSAAADMETLASAL